MAVTLRDARKLEAKHDPVIRQVVEPSAPPQHLWHESRLV
jgi:hypothetical protein